LPVVSVWGDDLDHLRINEGAFDKRRAMGLRDRLLVTLSEYDVKSIGLPGEINAYPDRLASSADGQTLVWQNSLASGHNVDLEVVEQHPTDFPGLRHSLWSYVPLLNPPWSLVTDVMEAFSLAVMVLAPIVLLRRTRPASMALLGVILSWIVLQLIYDVCAAMFTNQVTAGSGLALPPAVLTWITHQAKFAVPVALLDVGLSC
jgi:hypothetical protein